MDNTEAKPDTNTRKGYRGRKKHNGGRGGGWNGARSGTTDTAKQARQAERSSTPAEKALDWRRRSPPTEQAQPAQPVQPVEPIQPVQPVQPAKPTEPVEPAEPAEPVQPVQPAQPVEPVQTVQNAQPAELDNLKANIKKRKKEIKHLQRQHDELNASWEDRKKHLDVLKEEMTRASAKLDHIQDLDEQHARKEEALAKKEREVAQREQEIHDKQEIADLKIEQYQKLLKTLTLKVDPDIIECIDNIVERYYVLLKYQVSKTEEEKEKLRLATDSHTQEIKQLRARLQALEDKTSQ